MGYYIEVPERFNKAQQLCDLHGARLLKPMADHIGIINSPDETLVCVIKNELFDAARIVTDIEDYEYITMDRSDDDRPRVWLGLATHKVRELNPNAPV